MQTFDEAGLSFFYLVDGEAYTTWLWGKCEILYRGPDCVRIDTYVESASCSTTVLDTRPAWAMRRGAVRYDSRTPLSAPSRMSLSWRVFIVLCTVLLFMQGASAHVSISRDDHVVAHGIASVEHSQIIAGEAARCADMHCAHGHGLCCTTMCGVHCGALFVALRFEPWTPAATLPLPLADPHRVGISYAPLLRPPIA